MSNLDTFAKVRALHDSTTNPGEKAAAAGRMKVLARKAGMTVKQAMSKLDAPKPKTRAEAAAEAFNDIFNSPEMRAARAEREREDAKRRAAAVERYGSEDAVFADTAVEAALRAACDPLLIWDTRPGWHGCYILGGWSNHSGKGSMPLEVREAVTNGWPIPETVASAWAEYEDAEAIEDARYAFDGNYTPHRWTEARRYVLEDVLDTHPARSLNDLRARMSWLEFLSRKESSWTHEGDLIRLATLRADIERMGARLREQDASGVQNGQGEDGVANLHPTYGEGPAPDAAPLTSPDPGTSNSGVQDGQDQGGSDPMPPSPAQPEFYEEVVKPVPSATAVQSGHRRRTNADKRRDVLALLDVGKSDNAPLTDREIARRAGVSPTTVGTLRRRAARASSHLRTPPVAAGQRD
ncbi:Homeodomain-like domain-containing protein [Methylorubrum populi]